MDQVIDHSLRGEVTSSNAVPTVGFFDTLAAVFGIFLPTVAKGVIIRRPGMVAVAERFDLDRHAIRGMQRLRSVYGSGPLLLRIPGRSLALLVDPADAHRVLAETPTPFATATPEKTAALAHFEPKTSLISTGEERTE